MMNYGKAERDKAGVRATRESGEGEEERRRAEGRVGVRGGVFEWRRLD